MALEHRLLVYVFRRRGSAVEYLFGRRHPREEFAWTPLPTGVGPTESLFTAALRVMRAEWHAPQPQRFIELNVCDHQTVGDLDLIDWAAGYGVPAAWAPNESRPQEGLELQWSPLARAMQLLEREGERRALFRLHIEAAS